jgi:serine/threonine protein kinase
LPDNTHYFIDMELCDFTLEDRIREIGVGPIHEDVAAILDEDVAAILDEDVAVTPLNPMEFGSGQKSERRQLNTPQNPVQAPTENEVEVESSSGSAESPDFTPDTLPLEELGNWEPVLDILDDITSGLLYIHSKDVVHRDLKPKNGSSHEIIC